MGHGAADSAAGRSDVDDAGLKLKRYAGYGWVPARAFVVVRAAGGRRLSVVVPLGTAAAPGRGVRVSAGRQVNDRSALLATHAHEHIVVSCTCRCTRRMHVHGDAFGKGGSMRLPGKCPHGIMKSWS